MRDFFVKHEQRIVRYVRLNRVHCLAALSYTGYELRHASEAALVAILLWVAVCEVIKLFVEA